MKKNKTVAGYLCCRFHYMTRLTIARSSDELGWYRDGKGKGIRFNDSHYSNKDCRRRGKRVWTTCPESLRSCAPTGDRTHDPLIASLTPYSRATTPPARVMIAPPHHRRTVCVPDVNHRSLWTDRKSSTDGARTGEELDADGGQVEHVTHHGPVQKADHFWNSWAAGFLADELRTNQSTHCTREFSQ